MGQFILLAQEPAGSVAPWVQIISGLGVSAILGWYLWHTTTNTFPTMAKEHREAMKEITETHATQLTETRKDFKDSLKQVADHCSEEIEKFTSRFVK